MLGRNAVIVALLFALSVGGDAIAVQEPRLLKVRVAVLDGRNGKPMAEHRLIVLTGPWADRPIEVNQVLEARTDGTGRADITVDRSKVEWIRVAPDRSRLCEPVQNKGYPLDVIAEKGNATQNTCGKASLEPKPGEFIVYARPETFWESLSQ